MVVCMLISRLDKKEKGNDKSKKVKMISVFNTFVTKVFVTAALNYRAIKSQSEKVLDV